MTHPEPAGYVPPPGTPLVTQAGCWRRQRETLRLLAGILDAPRPARHHLDSQLARRDYRRHHLDLLTPDDVCMLLKVKKSWLYDEVERSALDAIRLGKQLRFRPSDLARYLDINKR
jgi:excisionase family DNA binding protein